MRAAGAVREIRMRWSPIQARFLQATARHVNYEGAVRSGKSTAAIWKILNYLIEYPGIVCMIARWTDEGLKTQLKPLFYKHCPPELLGEWNGTEHYQAFTNGSICYMRSLKAADDASRFAKFGGLTLAVIYLDQPEEVPADVYAALLGRLSQPGFPQQILLTPNPPAHDHWLAKEFPDDPAQLAPDHCFLRTTIYDNAAHLDDATIRGMEAKWPPGSVFRRRFLEGRRGLSAVGDPVYAGYFRREIHAATPVTLVRGTPLLRGWDFGHRHPAVLWAQFTPWGEWRILRELQGDNQFLEDFAPAVQAMTQQWFPEASELWDCGDPAGATLQGHGMRKTAVDVLADLDIHVRVLPASNDPVRRDFAIQQIARALMTWTKQGPAFQVDPSCKTLIDGLEAGYVWEEVKRSNTTTPSTRRPKKDGYYDHTQNVLEYLMLNFGGISLPDWTARKKAARQARHQGRDLDPADHYLSLTGRRVAVGRAGY
jgi:hypothetical protein